MYSVVNNNNKKTKTETIFFLRSKTTNDVVDDDTTLARPIPYVRRSSSFYHFPAQSNDMIRWAVDLPGNLPAPNRQVIPQTACKLKK